MHIHSSSDTPEPESPESEKKITKKVPKRVITERIESFFTSSKPTQPKITKLSKPSKPLKPPFFKLAGLNKIILMMAIIGGVGVVGAWLWWWFKFQDPNKLDKIVINPLYSYQSKGSIVATPLLVSGKTREGQRIVFADLLGNILALDGEGRLRYEYLLPKGVISSLIGIEVNKKTSKKVLAVSEEGDFVVLNQNGNYLYKSRDEFFNQNIFSKPAYIAEENLYILAGRKGTIWGVDAEYGEIRWIREETVLKDTKFFSAPLVYRTQKKSIDDATITPDIWVLGEDGQLVVLQKENGFLSWSLDLKDRFKASMVKGRFLKGSPVVAAASLSGQIYLVNSEGKLRHRLDLNESILATPSRIDTEEGEGLIVATEQGNVYRIIFNQDGNMISTKTMQVYQNAGSFISSPVSLDFNRDGIKDLLLLARTGEIIILNGKNFKMMNTPFSLNYQISATPLVADITGNGELEVMVGGENGRIEVLRLTYFPKYFFPAYTVLYSEFLNGPLNQN